MKRFTGIAKLGAVLLVLFILSLVGCGNTAWAGDGSTIVPPDWSFEVDGKYEIASGGFFTTTLTLSNNTAITQTAVTTITAGGAFIQQFLGYQAPGVVEGTSSIWKASLNGAFQSLHWTVDVPAYKSVSFVLLAQAVETDTAIAADGYVTWEVGEDVLTKGISILPVANQPVLRIESVNKNPAWRGSEVCISGEFEVVIENVFLLYNQSNTINQQPSRQSAGNVCFFTTHFPSETFVLKVADAKGNVSNGVLFRVIGEVYLPITLR